MLGTTRNVSAYVCTEPTDMRRGFNGLWALARDVLGQDVLSGHMFLFVSRDLKRAKVLMWDGTGLVLYSKRLEQGRFSWPKGEGASVTWRGERLSALLNGLEVREKDGWYRR